eukprot:GHVT01022948.1.p2 GENE.GHVT01022948.1~~GHVT01022948.1.p2  ORF type:complete len:156 (+),score=19.28 GHVT01022948.1:903-1370(+)
MNWLVTPPPASSRPSNCHGHKFTVKPSPAPPSLAALPPCRPPTGRFPTNFPVARAKCFRSDCFDFFLLANLQHMFIYSRCLDDLLIRLDPLFVVDHTEVVGSFEHVRGEVGVWEVPVRQNGLRGDSFADEEIEFSFKGQETANASVRLRRVGLWR